MELKGLSDKRVIEFLAKSPVKSFTAIADTLTYLDGQWFYEDLEYELFDWAFGDNPEGKVTIRLPRLRGLALPVLFKLTRLLEEFHLIRCRRAYDEPDPEDPMEGELRICYELTSAGRKLRFLLSQIVLATELINLEPSDMDES